MRPTNDDVLVRLQIEGPQTTTTEEIRHVIQGPQSGGRNAKWSAASGNKAKNQPEGSNNQARYCLTRQFRQASFTQNCRKSSQYFDRALYSQLSIPNSPIIKPDTAAPERFLFSWYLIHILPFLHVPLPHVLLPSLSYRFNMLMGGGGS